MSKKIENKPYRFLTLDGVGNDRAEVLVQRGQATVQAINLFEDKNIAQVMFKVVPVGNKANELKPIPAWISLDNSKLLEHLQAAHNSGERVEYRFEVQRKPHVDRSLPFDDIYQTMEDAKNNTIRVVAIIDGIESSERVTNPSEDPNFGNGSRHRADENSVGGNHGTPNSTPLSSHGFDKDSSIKALKGMKSTPGTDPAMIQMAAAFAVMLGADTNEVNSILWSDKGQPAFKPATHDTPRSFAIEAPRYQDFNSDGRINLGSAYVASAVSMESAVSRNILNRYHDEVDGKPLLPSQLKGFNEFVRYFTDLSFSMCDYAQASMYGVGAFPSRKADSHTRIRGIFIDLIERFFYIPVVVDGDTLVLHSDEEVDEWVKNVGSEIMKRFQTALSILPNRSSFKDLREARKGLPKLGGVDSTEDTHFVPEAVQTATSLPDVSDHEISQESKVVDDAVDYDQSEPFANEESEEESRDVPLVFDESFSPTSSPDSVEDKGEELPSTTSEAPVESPVVDNAPVEADKPVVDADRLKLASDLLKNFKPSASYIEDIKNEDVGMFPAEDEANESTAIEVAPGVIKIPAAGVEGPMCGDEEVMNFKALLDESGFNLGDPQHVKTAGKILRFVFGPDFTQAQKVPAALMDEFIDWYASAGPEAMTTLQDLAHAEFPG